MQIVSKGEHGYGGPMGLQWDKVASSELDSSTTLRHLSSAMNQSCYMYSDAKGSDCQLHRQGPLTGTSFTVLTFRTSAERTLGELLVS